MQDFLLCSAIPGPDRSRPVPACPADSHRVIVYPPAIQIATLDLLNFIKNESWVPCKMQNGGMGAAGFISSLGRDFADWVVIESLALPCLMASLLRRGSSAAQGDGEHGVPPRFFRRARCAAPANGVPKPDSASGMGDREGRPYGVFCACSEQRVQEAAPYKERTTPWRAATEAVPPFRRGWTLAAPLRGFCHFGAPPHPPRFARHLPPWRGKARAADSRPYGGYRGYSLIS